MRRHRLLYIIIFFLITFLLGFDFKCSDDEKDTIKIQVITTCPSIDPVTGYYIVNGSRPIYFTESNSGATGAYLNSLQISTEGLQEFGGFSYFEANINELDETRIKAFRNDCSYSLEIYIYKDGDEVDNATLATASAGCTTNELSKTYTY